MSKPAKIAKFTSWIASTECAIFLFLAIAAIAIPGTFTENRTIYSSSPFLFLLACFGVNLIACTWKRRNSISKPVIVLHGGVIITMLGCFATTFGYIATINVYENDSASQFYRWDQKRDNDLGFTLFVDKIHFDHNPIPVKIGVLKGQQKEKLFTLKTGDSFEYGKYRVKVNSPIASADSLDLTVSEKDKTIGIINTNGHSGLPTDFPYNFKLVAFQTPHLKRLWVDLRIRTAAGQEIKGISEVNNPFQWDGLYFYNTQIEWDKNGRAYAGIQIVKDPGRPIVFAGFTVMAIGAVLSFARRFSMRPVNA